MPSTRRDKEDVDSGDSWSIGTVAVILCLLVAVGMGFWHFSNRK